MAEGPMPTGDGRRHALRATVIAVALVVAMVFGTIGAFAFGGYLGGKTEAAAPQAVRLAATATTAQGNSAAQGVSGLSVADVAAKANPAVVTISNLQNVGNGPGGFFGFPNGNNNGPGSNGNNNDNNGNNGNGAPQVVGKGSGFIIDNKGDVITNAHVVDGADQLQVEFYNGKTASATLVGEDTVQDIAVIKIDLSGGATLPGIATLGNSSAVRAGDPVVAIGSALGTFTNTVTDGIVGGVDRSLDEGNGQVLPNLIQHDAPLSSGNSGGPLLNMQGQVVGVNVAAIPNGSQLGGNQANGLGFAIEINTAKNIAQQLIATGKVTYPYLGVELQDYQGGEAVVQVEQGTPADKAGLQPGDVITAINGQQIDDQHPLQSLLYAHKPGDKVTLTVNRDGSTKTIEVTLGTRPAQTQ